MLHSKKGVKLIAIISAVCLLLAGVVAGTVFALTSRNVVAETTERGTVSGQYSFTIEGDGSLFSFDQDGWESFQGVLDEQSSWDSASTTTTSNKLSGIKKLTDSKYQVWLSASTAFTFYYHGSSNNFASTSPMFGFKSEEGVITAQDAQGNSISTNYNGSKSITRITLTPAQEGWTSTLELFPNLKPVTYTVAPPTASSNYTFTPVDEQGTASTGWSVESGKPFYFQAKSNVEGKALTIHATNPDNFQTVEVRPHTVAGKSDLYKIEKVESNLNLSVEVNAITYKVTGPTDNANVTYTPVTGEAAPNGDWRISHGTSFNFTLTPKNNYTITGITYTVENGEQGGSFEVNSSGTYTIPGTQVKGDITITVTAQGPCTIQWEDNNYTHTGDEQVPYKTAYAFTVTPDEGYTIESVSYKVGEAGETKSLKVSASGSYTIPANDVTGNITITVTAKEATYNVVFGSSEQSVIKGEHVATFNTAYQFTVTPNAGYSVNEVRYRVGNAATQTLGVSDRNTYTIPGENIKGDITITATTTVKSYTVKATVNGTDYNAETGNEAATFTGGSSATVEAEYIFTVSAKPGFTVTIVDVTIGGNATVPTATSVEGGTRYMLAKGSVTGNVNIAITTTAVTYKLALSKDDSYQFAVSNGAEYDGSTDSFINIAYNGTVTFTLKATDGYSLRDVQVTYNNVEFKAKADDDGAEFFYEDTDNDGNEGRTYTVTKVVKDGQLSVVLSSVKKVWAVSNASANDDGYTLKVKVGSAEEGTEIKQGVSVTALEGDNVSIVVTHNEGFGFAALSVNLVNILNELQTGVDYSLGKINEDKLIRVTTAENTYTVIYHDPIDFKDQESTKTVELKYTAVQGPDNDGFSESGTYTLLEDSDTYYDRAWRTDATSDQTVKTVLNKSEIVDKSLTINLYAVWTWNKDANATMIVGTLLKLKVTTTPAGKDQSSIYFAYDLPNREDWQALVTELVKHSDSIEALGFIYTAHDKYTSQNSTNKEFSSILKAVLDDANPGDWKKSVSGSATCWYVLELTGPNGNKLPAFAQINAWNWKNENTRYGWTFSGMDDKQFNQRMVKGWVSLTVGGERLIFEEKELKVVSEYSTAAANAALLPEAPSMEEESYEEPTIE